MRLGSIISGQDKRIADDIQQRMEQKYYRHVPKA